MNCHQIEPHIVDMARGLKSERDAQLARHVLGCPSCAGLLERERVMSGTLRRLAHDLREPAADPQLEQALLAAFDRAVTRPRRRRPALRWTGLAAAGVAFAVVLTWHFARPSITPDTSTAPVAPFASQTEQAAALDSGSLVTAATPSISGRGRASRSPGARPRPNDDVDSTGFVEWPGAAAWPPFESGELIRVDIPTTAGVVQADVLVGQDGFARAVRLVQ